MADASKNFYAGTLGTTPGTTVYTPPASTQATLLRVRVVNKSSGAAKFYLGRVLSGVTTWLYYGLSIPANGAPVVEQAYEVLPSSSTTLTAYSDTGSALDCTLNGVEIT